MNPDIVGVIGLRIFFDEYSAFGLTHCLEYFPDILFGARVVKRGLKSDKMSIVFIRGKDSQIIGIFCPNNRWANRIMCVCRPENFFSDFQIAYDFTVNREKGIHVFESRKFADVVNCMKIVILTLLLINNVFK